MCLQMLPDPNREPRTLDEAFLTDLVSQGYDTVRGLHRALTDVPPTRSSVERLRRRLEAAVRSGVLVVDRPERGGRGGTLPSRYRIADWARTPAKAG
jgi:hypothetical protein